MLTTFDLDEYVYEALRAGASGFLLKDAPADELVHAVRVVAAGDALVSPSVMRRLIADFIRQPQTTKADPVALDELTPREREVLHLVARGLSNAEISATLVVAPQTTKTHVSRILRKLNCATEPRPSSPPTSPGSSRPANDLIRQTGSCPSSRGQAFFTFRAIDEGRYPPPDARELPCRNHAAPAIRPPDPVRASRRRPAARVPALSVRARDLDG